MANEQKTPRRKASSSAEGDAPDAVSFSTVLEMFKDLKKDIASQHELTRQQDKEKLESFRIEVIEEAKKISCTDN